MKTVNHIRLTPDDMEEVIPIPHLNLRGIIEDACYRPKAGHPYLLFSCHVEDYRNRKCRFCGSTAVHAHGQTGAPRRIHDVNSGRTKVDIDLTVQRYICSECGRSFSPPSPDIMESRHLTRQSGMDAATVKKIAGHSDEKMTNYYTHIEEEQAKVVP